MDRFVYSFKDWIWQHFPVRLQALKESIMKRFISAMLLPFKSIANQSNNLYDQIYFSSCSEESLRKHAAPYKLEQKTDESKEDFLYRLRLWRLIITAGGIKKSIKTALKILTGVSENQIIIQEGIRSSGTGPFIIGVTPLGSGSILHSTQIFTFKVILPDLSHMQLNREHILKELDEFSPSNEFKITEKRENYDYEWEVL